MKAWILAALTCLAPAPAHASLPVRLDGLLPHCKSEFYRARVKMNQAKVGYRITSAYRSYADQLYLYRHRGTNRYPVAKPGHSDHGRGKAIDLVFVKNALSGRKIMRSFGFKQPVPHDPVHWVCPGEPAPKPPPKPAPKAVRKVGLEAPMPLMEAAAPDPDPDAAFETPVILDWIGGHLSLEEAQLLLGLVLP